MTKKELKDKALAKGFGIIKEYPDALLVGFPESNTLITTRMSDKVVDDYFQDVKNFLDYLKL